MSNSCIDSFFFPLQSYLYQIHVPGTKSLPLLLKAQALIQTIYIEGLELLVLTTESDSDEWTCFKYFVRTKGDKKSK